MAREAAILALNVGSATVKWQLFALDDLRPLAGGLVDRIGLKPSRLVAEKDGQRREQVVAGGLVNADQALKLLRRIWLELGISPSQIKGVGHRVVHGGPTFTKPEVISAAVISKLRRLNDVAPLHNPHNIAGIVAARRFFPRARHVACFDTAYFSNLPLWASTYALPWQLVKKHKLWRYGFHGLSHQYVAEAAAEALGRPLKKVTLVTCHLGSGASVAAIKQGVPLDVSMGFTPLEGLVMGTRSGDIDPGVLLYLQRVEKLSVEALDRLLNFESGLKGLSGVSSDMREVLAAAGFPVIDGVDRKPWTSVQRDRARLAISVFVYRIQKYVGAYATIMGGLDAIVFTGGIGEGSPAIRQMIMAGLSAWRGVRSLIIPTDEGYVIARETKRLL